MDKKQEYSRLLAECLYIKRREAKEEEYNRAIARANKFLRDVNSIVTDAEALLNDDGSIRAEANTLVSGYPVLGSMLLDASRLWHELIDLGGAVGDLELVLAISAARNMEREIIAEYGKSWGEVIVYEAMSNILTLEDEFGVTLYREKVARNRDRFAVKLLFPLTKIEVGVEDLDEEMLSFENGFGDRYTAKRWARMYEGGEYYLELELLGDVSASFNYYKLVSRDSRQALLVVDDKDEIKRLDGRREELEIAQNGR